MEISISGRSWGAICSDCGKKAFSTAEMLERFPSVTMGPRMRAGREWRHGGPPLRFVATAAASRAPGGRAKGRGMVVRSPGGRAAESESRWRTVRRERDSIKLSASETERERKGVRGRASESESKRGECVAR